VPKSSKNAAFVTVRGAKTALPEASKTPPNGSKMPPNGSENGLRVEYRPLNALIPFARKTRTHSEEQIAHIYANIRGVRVRQSYPSGRRKRNYRG
jgi:hypothetical protein